MTSPHQPPPPTVGGLLAAARQRLSQSALALPAREAQLLLAEALGWNEARVMARPEAEVPPQVAARLDDWLARRERGEPVAYLLGRREFYGRNFRVDSRVLIPRPETEHLVEMALACPLPANPRVLDLGTGSGILAVTLACELPRAWVLATDLSLAALVLARSNAVALGVGPRVAGLLTDLADGVAVESFDLVVSNPPYVDPQVELSPEVRNFEPHLALFAPEGGRAILRRILALGARLRPGVDLLLEIGYDQGEWLTAAAATSALELVELRRDYAGHPRIAHLRRRAG